MTVEEFVKILIPALMGSLGAYAAIRADLARFGERADNALEKAKEASSSAGDASLIATRALEMAIAAKSDGDAAHRRIDALMKQ